MAIDSAINHESGGYNGSIFAGFSQCFGLEAYFAGAGKFDVRHDWLAR